MWGFCRNPRSEDNRCRLARTYSLLFLLVLWVSSLAAQNTDSIVWRINQRMGDTIAAFPLTQHTYTLGTRPVLASSLRVVRTTLPADITPLLLLDSTATQLRIVAQEATDLDTVWLQFRPLQLSTSQEFSVYALLDSVSPSDLPRWKQIQNDQRMQRQTLAQPPFRLRGYAEREATVGESIQSPFAGRMHLELEGELESGLRIAGELSDQSLPFQPDGTTTQVKALDKLYLSVADSLWKAEGGDIELHANHHFLYYNTPIQGIRYTNETRTSRHDTVHFDVALGVAKGEYTEVDLLGQEAIQGPYRIYASSALLQVAAIAGSEYVYLDGRLLVRGFDKDYTIDYNLGEIRFTIHCPIRAGSRIHVKYEKASQRYTRYLLHADARSVLRNGWGLEWQTYVAHDAASTLQVAQHQQEALNGLAQLEATQDAYRWNEEEKTDGKYHGGYILLDTLVGAVHYSVFRYVAAGERDSVYIPQFRYATNGGDYLQVQGENNEPIYVWQAPYNGRAQGNYLVGEEITPPQSHKLVQATASKEQEQYKAKITVAYSHFDKNTLQTVARTTKQGIATEAQTEWHLLAQGEQQLWLGGKARVVLRDFMPVQNYLPVDFRRHWGLQGDRPNETWGDASLWLRLQNSRGTGQIAANQIITPQFLGLALNEESYFRWLYVSWKNGLSARNLRGDSLRRWVGQWHSELSLYTPILRPAYFVEAEMQATRKPSNAMNDDYRWIRTGLRTSWGDSTLYDANLELAFRHDESVQIPVQQPRRITWEATAQTNLRLQRYGNYRARINYQNLLAYNAIRPTRTQVLLAQLTGLLSLWRERLRLHWQQELSTENTPEWQQHFIRVPDGQGRYMWLDANGDGIEQLDEFVVAAFRDQGKYVLQMVPASTVRATRTNSVQLGVNITPRAEGRAIDSLSRWYERLDLEFNTTLGQKRTNGNWMTAFVPWGDLRQALQLRRTFNLQLWYNKNASPLQGYLGGVYSLQQQQLSQGLTATQERSYRAGILTPNTSPQIAELAGEWLSKKQRIPYGTQSELDSHLWSLRGVIGKRYASNAEQHIEVRQTWLRVNQNPQLASMTECEYLLSYPFAQKFSAEVRITYARTALLALQNNPLAYSLTRGYADGHNIVNHLTLRYKLSRHVELSATYELRKLGLIPIQQTGNLAVRTLF